MKVYKNFNLTNYNSYKVNSNCSIAYFPETEDDFIKLFRELRNKNHVVLGNGNNIILSKNFYEQPFVILNGTFNKISIKDELLEAEAGATTLELSIKALRHNLSGAEFLYDIPSSIGGAVVMNAGTKEGETKNILNKVRYLDLNNLTIKEKLNHEINLSYRNSYFQNKKDKIILKAWFQLENGEQNQIENLMNESKERRWSKQPREFPNCGSVFKRPPGKFVGPMLDELGLKGFTIGEAQVSEKHSGFIINNGKATGKDILKLINHIKEKVFQNFNIVLEVEQRII